MNPYFLQLYYSAESKASHGAVVAINKYENENIIYIMCVLNIKCQALSGSYRVINFSCIYLATVYIAN